ncbi:Ger(x)C family spore germination protein [Paenibacillus turpanensis]|uniref:Ger(x)C family spore germination protein n=1 Tax=Paenibacillus turpanensis TaxID=2689078 RepID=UPI0024418301|nr:Ger(x)C family spore germination protein [Paenibacillus turpanensis]
MKHCRIWLKIWCSLLLFMILTGCWDRLELNEISLVTGLAIDQAKDHKYRLTVEVLNGTELNPKTKGDSAPTVVFSHEGDNIAELAKKLNIGLSRHLVFSHMRVIVISEQIAKAGMLEFFDFLERHREIRDDFNILISKGVPAANILKITYPLQKASTMKLNIQMPTLYEEWGGDPDVRMKDVVSALLSPGREPVTAVVRVKGNAKSGGSTENLKKVEPSALVVMEGAGVFRGQHLQGILPVHEIPYMLLLQKKLKRTNLSIACAKNKQFTVQIDSTTRIIKASYKNGSPHFLINVYFGSRLISTECSDDLEKPETFRKYEEKIETKLEEEIKKVIEKAQNKYKADIFGLGEEMNRQNHSQFKKVKDDWNEEFARAKIEVRVNGRLWRSGLIRKPYLQDVK